MAILPSEQAFSLKREGVTKGSYLTLSLTFTSYNKAQNIPFQ